jgi:hypothetical protein
MSASSLAVTVRRVRTFHSFLASSALTLAGLGGAVLLHGGPQADAAGVGILAGTAAFLSFMGLMALRDTSPSRLSRNRARTARRGLPRSP